MAPLVSNEQLVSPGSVLSNAHAHRHFFKNNKTLEPTTYRAYFYKFWLLGKMTPQFSVPPYIFNHKIQV